MQLPVDIDLYESCVCINASDDRDPDVYDEQKMRLSDCYRWNKILVGNTHVTLIKASKKTRHVKIYGPDIMSLPEREAREELAIVLSRCQPQNGSAISLYGFHTITAIADFFKYFGHDHHGLVPGFSLFSHPWMFEFRNDKQACLALANFFDSNEWPVFSPAGIDNLAICYVDGWGEEEGEKLGKSLARTINGSTLGSLDLQNEGSNSTYLIAFLLVLSRQILMQSIPAKVQALVFQHIEDNDGVDLGNSIAQLVHGGGFIRDVQFFTFDLTIKHNTKATFLSMKKWLGDPQCNLQNLCLYCSFDNCNQRQKGFLHACHLFEGLSRNTSIMSLWLKLPSHDRRIWDDVAFQLSYVLGRNRTLQSVYMPMSLSESGAQVLAETMTHRASSSLSSLVVYEAASDLAVHGVHWNAALKKNPYLAELSFEGFRGTPDENEPNLDILRDIMLLLCLNRSGRHLYFHKPRKGRQKKRAKRVIPVGLWPHVLARVSRERANVLCDCSLELGIGHADIIHRMLRDVPALYATLIG